MKELSKELQASILSEKQHSGFDAMHTGSLDFTKSNSPISDYCAYALKHCNAGAAVNAAYELRDFLKSGGKIFLSIAGALSSFQIGKVLAELIRKDKIHGISATGANFEESFYRYVAHSHYKYIPNYTDLTPEQEAELRDAGYRRITDTFLPEEQSVKILEPILNQYWKEATKNNQSYLPHEYMFRLFEEDKIKPDPNSNPLDCWAKAAWEKDIQVVVPGWEDSTVGNIFAAYSYDKKENVSSTVVKSGVHYMHSMYDWYQGQSKKPGIAFLQLGGGIAGDFPICVVPSLKHDLYLENVMDWASFTEISSSPMSYGSYSGAGGKEKITWDKLSTESRYTIIQSDATIVFPLIAAILLEI